MNIRTLINHIIDRAVDRLTDTEAMEALAGAVAGEIDEEAIAGKLDLDFITDKVMDSIEVDSAAIAGEISLPDLAYELDTGEIAQSLDMGDLAEYVDTDDVIESIGDISESVARHLDYAKLAQNLNPMEALAASQDGKKPEPVVPERFELNGMAARLMDAAVNRLLFLANKKIEEDLAHAEQQASPNSNDNGGE